MNRHALDRDDDYSIYQTSTMAALLAGVYDGEVTIDELLDHGNFGLGTFNHLDGEMVVLDGVCYHLRDDGTVTRATGQEMTPFAAVTRFHPDITLPVAAPLRLSALNAKIDDAAGSDNLPLAVRVEGLFDEVQTRTVGEQSMPYPPLVDAAAHERTSVFVRSRGTIVGFRTPQFEEAIAVAGYHLHYIDDDRTKGGHVLDLTIASGTVSFCALSELHLSLPGTAQFRGAEIRLDELASDERQAEGPRQ